MLLPNLRGNYSFLPGIEPFSSGVIASRGYEIIHVTLDRLPPYREGFEIIDAHLRAEKRPRTALCGIELRSPVPFTRAGFTEFNAGYQALLEDWNLKVGGHNPIARTNVAPQRHPPEEPVLFAFSYTAPAGHDMRRTFVVAGAGEFRAGSLEQAEVVRGGETTPDAMREKAAHVMATISRRLAGLGVGWSEVTTLDLYTVQPIEAALGPVMLDGIGSAAIRGLRWYHARPPIVDLEFELDARGVRIEQYL
jgi:hypothetical protein